MFEFEKDAGDLSDYTLVLPAVSVGNVGEFSAFLFFFLSLLLWILFKDFTLTDQKFYRRPEFVIK
jgi:hypothetical protein